jgi:hypothetical protein
MASQPPTTGDSLIADLLLDIEAADEEFAAILGEQRPGMHASGQTRDEPPSSESSLLDLDYDGSIITSIPNQTTLYDPFEGLMSTSVALPPSHHGQDHEALVTVTQGGAQPPRNERPTDSTANNTAAAANLLMSPASEFYKFMSDEAFQQQQQQEQLGDPHLSKANTSTTNNHPAEEFVTPGRTQARLSATSILTEKEGAFEAVACDDQATAAIIVSAHFEDTDSLRSEPMEAQVERPSTPIVEIPKVALNSAPAPVSASASASESAPASAPSLVSSILQMKYDNPYSAQVGIPGGQQISHDSSIFAPLTSALIRSISWVCAK